ncbi:unnamed protein product [Porites lobata]|uniref:Uncharacterized protein n=1 Tax=Porites lobata TaxID=104759 RepID=A0ABN8P9N7_9CNID|nr:unnamed protein product [Porites lobata]
MGSPYSTEKLRDYKPSNCTLVKNSKEEDPYREARRFISEDTKHNCCNVGRDNSVQRWQLPRGRSKVLLKKAAMADSGRWNSSRSITMCEEEVLGSAYHKLRGYEPFKLRQQRKNYFI